MSGNGVTMMNKFIKVNKLENEDSPAIFLAVYEALKKRLNRIEKIKAIYKEDGDEAPLTNCPHCGSPSLVIRNCEFCGYALIDGEVLEVSEMVTNEEPEVEVKEEIKEEVKEEVKEEPKSRASGRVKKQLTEEDVLKARRPGLKRIIEAEKIETSLDLETAELKVIRKEITDVLFNSGDIVEAVPETPAEPKKETVEEVKEEPKTETPRSSGRRSRGASAEPKAEVKKLVDFSDMPSYEELSGMNEDKVIDVIKKYELVGLEKESEALLGDLDDDTFYAHIDTIYDELEQASIRVALDDPKIKVKPSKIKKEDIPEAELAEGEAKIDGVEYIADMSEIEMVASIRKFGLDTKIPNTVAMLLNEAPLSDNMFFKCLDTFNAELEKLYNKLEAGNTLYYPIPRQPKEEEKRPAPRRTKAVKQEEEQPVLDTDDNFENVDLDNAEVDYSDINIEDIN